MAVTANERLVDAAAHHSVDLAQYSTGVVRRLIAILNLVDADLAAALSVAIEKISPSAFTVERLERLLGSVRKLNAEAYAKVDVALMSEIKDFAAYEAGYQSQLLTRIVPAPIRTELKFAEVSVNQVYAASLSRPFQGRLLADWAQSLEVGRMQLLRNTIRIGFVEGKTTEQIISRIRGTRAKGYADGLLNRSRLDLEAVVRTAISHTAEVSRERLHEANDDIVKAVRWVSTLDSKTSDICKAHDGKQYTLKEHKPIGHRLPWLGGPGRAHWRCRSTSVPVLKSWQELGFKLSDISPGTRASMDGQIPADLDYGDWLERQSAARQDEIVGPIRGQLMRAGKLPFDKLYSDRGDWLTLEQLRARDAAAFARAGL